MICEPSGDTRGSATCSKSRYLSTVSRLSTRFSWALAPTGTSTSVAAANVSQATRERGRDMRGSCSGSDDGLYGSAAGLSNRVGATPSPLMNGADPRQAHVLLGVPFVPHVHVATSVSVRYNERTPLDPNYAKDRSSARRGRLCAGRRPDPAVLRTIRHGAYRHAPR